MPTCEVQRTLVKSPPELWAELSDPASLARHLGEFGEIRTTRVEPETAVEWEAQDVRGVVQLKPSGWGTKVTLTAIRELPADDIVPVVEAEREPAVEHELAIELEPAVEPEPALEAELEPVVEAEPEAEPALERELLSGRRSGFFARIFRRRRKARPETGAVRETGAVPEPEGEHDVEAAPAPTSEPGTALPSAVEPEAAPEPAVEPEPTPEPEAVPEDLPDLAAELAGVEAAMAAQDAALLSAVLDRLGAAHHRPFSRG